jgi:hypothetical protein
MSNWRKLLWATIPTAEEANTHPVDKLATDVKAYILMNIDANYSNTVFLDDFEKFATEAQESPLYLNTVLFYVKQGYDYFVEMTANEVYSYSEDAETAED